jgi:molybdate transport system substrate-binding protein
MRSWTRREAFAASAAVLALPARAQSPDVIVFAAASLKNALDAVAADYRAAAGNRVAISYGASSALARQIEQGAPADVFFSADVDWMEYLGVRKLVRDETRRDLLGNRIVVVAPASQAVPLELKPGALAERLRGGRLATANVAAVPAGKYGKAAFEQLGLWPEVAGRLAEAENVRAALVFVARGEAPLGVVYATDAHAESAVAVVARLPDDSHPPIVYPVALTANAKGVEPARFLDHLLSPAAHEAFVREGFTILLR